MFERDSSITPKSAAASTDLLRRRVLLPYALRLILRDSSICIRTDSALMSEVLNNLNLQCDHSGVVANAEWEIAVETKREAEADLSLGTEFEPVEIYHIGPSCALRMCGGSWFAHTPPSLCSVGFAMVAGNEREQIDQLTLYFRAIMSLLEKDGARSNSAMTLEVCS